MDSLVIEENNYKYYISQKFNNLHILAIKQKSCKVYELILDNYQEQINYNNISIVINAEYIFQQLKQYAEKTNILTDFQFMFNKNLLVIKMSIEYIGYIKLLHLNKTDCWDNDKMAKLLLMQSQQIKKLKYDQHTLRLQNDFNVAFGRWLLVFSLLMLAIKLI